MADKSLNRDLTDSEKDKQKLQQDKAILDLPDVKDIPGQENIKVPNMSEMADTTISSDDEEGLVFLKMKTVMMRAVKELDLPMKLAKKI